MVFSFNKFIYSKQIIFGTVNDWLSALGASGGYLPGRLISLFIYGIY